MLTPWLTAKMTNKSVIVLAFTGILLLEAYATEEQQVKSAEVNASFSDEMRRIHVSGS